MLAIAPFGASFSYAGDVSVSKVAVLGNGHTRLSIVTDGVAAEADILTRIRPGHRLALGEVTACTQSRTPCVLVSRLLIRVGKVDIFVPGSVALRLADVNRASLHRLAADRFELVLECGDAAEAYDAHVLFDTKRVTQLDIIDSEAGVLAERTVYANLSHVFDN